MLRSAVGNMMKLSRVVQSAGSYAQQFCRRVGQVNSSYKTCIRKQVVIPIIQLT